MATLCLSLVSVASADTFGTGANQFDIDFVTISGDAGDLGSWPSGFNRTFSGVNRDDYRIGIYEITNDQWDKFTAELRVAVTGTPSDAYNAGPGSSGANIPVTNVSWYELAQFVNWLNTSTGHQAAYKFTGTQGTSDYAMDKWSSEEAENGTNLYRHKDALYYLPTEEEWIKAAYWNGTSLQTYATKAGENLHQGDGVSGTGWNYYRYRYATNPAGVWEVGSGSEELNGTYDMMGNVYEWTESQSRETGYKTTASREVRGGWWVYLGDPAPEDCSEDLSSTVNLGYYPDTEHSAIGFRIASDVPEPCSLGLLALGGLALIRRRRT